MADLTIARLLGSFDGLSPDGESVVNFTVSSDMLWGFLGRGIQSQLDDAWFIPDVASDPAGIWKGLERRGQQETLCYAGIPTGNFSRIGMDHFQEGRVFTIFCVPEDDANFVVTKWRWHDMCETQQGFPINHKTRFGRRLWPDKV